MSRPLRLEFPGALYHVNGVRSCLLLFVYVDYTDCELMIFLWRAGHVETFAS